MSKIQKLYCSRCHKEIHESKIILSSSDLYCTCTRTMLTPSMSDDLLVDSDSMSNKFMRKSFIDKKRKKEWRKEQFKK